jgi:hypothetical protein
MRVRHAREIGILFDLDGKGAQQRVDAYTQHRQSAAHAIRLDGVFDIHRGRAEMQFAAADLRL